jgi:HTH-type transcriptional regulator, transcriptional repressor of NAD biosynthesis genes
VDVVVADTTGLVVAAYSAHYFADGGLWPDALARQRGIDLTLLMGLDLPWQPDGLFRDSPAVREAIDRHLRQACAIDRHLRQALQGAGLPFTPVYGRGPLRLAQALRAVQNRLEAVSGGRLSRPLVATDAVLEQGSGRWSCDNCSDPDCEHRLFSRLVQQRGGGAG